MILKKGICVLFSIPLLLSCSKEIKLNFPKYQKHLVVKTSIFCQHFGKNYTLKNITFLKL